MIRSSYPLALKRSSATTRTLRCISTTRVTSHWKPTIKKLLAGFQCEVTRVVEMHLSVRVEVHFYDTGHFALETHHQEIAGAIRDFLMVGFQCEVTRVVE